MSKLRDSGVAPTDIMQISGHKNIQSVLNYSTMSEIKHKEISSILTGKKMKNPYLSDSILLQTQRCHQTQQLLRLCLPQVHFVMLLLATPPINKAHVTTWHFHHKITQIYSSTTHKTTSCSHFLRVQTSRFKIPTCICAKKCEMFKFHIKMLFQP